MTRPRRAVAALAAATLTVLAVGASPANAERARHTDAKQDVITLFASGTPEDDLEVVPGNKNTDITRTVMRHSPNRVIMRTHLRDLTPDTGMQVYQLRTDKGRFQAMQLLARDLDGGILARSARAAGLPRLAAKAAPMPRFVLMSEKDGYIDCEGLTYWGHRKKDVVRMSIPRSCLGNPSWVRFSAVVVSVDPVGERMFADDALARGIEIEEMGTSRRLTRG